MPAAGLFVRAGLTRPDPVARPRIIYSRRRADVHPGDLAKLLHATGVTETVDISQSARSVEGCLTMVAAFTPLLDNKGQRSNGNSCQPLEGPCQEGAS
eukprot:evm.model.scf_426.4 EVM.evm.TU.scf_426.4   scf_426:39162-40226(-)